MQQPAPTADQRDGNLEIELPPDAILRAENRLLRGRNAELEAMLAQHMAVIEVLTKEKQ